MPHVSTGGKTGNLGPHRAGEALTKIRKDVFRWSRFEIVESAHPSRRCVFEAIFVRSDERRNERRATENRVEIPSGEKKTLARSLSASVRSVRTHREVRTVMALDQN